jgi:tetratricopeptide (TPR) repeat protein
VHAHCTLARFAELPVTMTGAMRPMVHAQINGADALFIADSGAFYSSLTPAAAEQFGLPLKPAPIGLMVQGVGGATRPSVATVKTFTLAQAPIRDIEFLVLGNDLGDGAAGLLGQNVLRIADLEYDLANGVIRFIRPQDCKNAVLAYWAAPGSEYSVMDIEPATPGAPHTEGVAYVNGNKLRVIFDTGAASSDLSLEAAKRAGVTPESPGVVSAGQWVGIGHHYTQSWIAPFASFKIGDEEVRNTKLRIGALSLNGIDMLVGADFFLSHHIYVASSQRKLYFTYNGGPVFNLASKPPLTATLPSADAQPAAAGKPAAVEESGAAAAVAHPAEPTDAATFARRGAASAARHDYEHALADLTRACELAPSEASYFYERGLAHWNNGQPELALADFNEAIRLKPEDEPSLVARARLRASRKEAAAAVAADLDVADQVAPKEAEERLSMGELYESIGQHAAAVVQYSKWIESHQSHEDVRMAEALIARCWARAQWGEQLEQGLADCDGALRLRPKSARILSCRGFVYFRRGDYDKAIADYDAALRLAPRGAWALYARGIAHLRLGQGVQGHADITAATTLDPHIAETAAKEALSP